MLTPRTFPCSDFQPCRLTNYFLPSFWLHLQSGCVLTHSDFLSHAVVGMIPTETVTTRLADSSDTKRGDWSRPKPSLHQHLDHLTYFFGAPPLRSIVTSLPRALHGLWWGEVKAEASLRHAPSTVASFVKFNPLLGGIFRSLKSSHLITWFSTYQWVTSTFSFLKARLSIMI